jgi:hypothetical protein
LVEDDAKGTAKDNGEEETPSKETTSSGEEETPSKVKTSMEAKESDDKPSSKVKLAKLAKLSMLIKAAKSTDLWCLSPFVPAMQEAKAKQRKVCPVNLRGEVCTANNCGNKHPKVCIVAAHGKGKIPKATCALWHMRVPFTTQGNFTGRRSSPNPPPGSKGSNSSKAKVRLAKPDMNLVKLEATAKAEELKARIRAAKMMLQSITYRQVVEGPVDPPQPLAHVAPRDQQQARPALSPEGAIAMLEEVIRRLRIPFP